MIGQNVRWTLFEYLYRDAGNFKAFGAAALCGAAAQGDEQRLRHALLDGEYFVAEQVDLPPLYGQLYEWSDGATAGDHCWHEFVGLRVVSADEVGLNTPRIGFVRAFVDRFAAIDEWDGALSRNFDLGV